MCKEFALKGKNGSPTGSAIWKQITYPVSVRDIILHDISVKMVLRINHYFHGDIYNWIAWLSCLSKTQAESLFMCLATFFLNLPRLVYMLSALFSSKKKHLCLSVKPFLKFSPLSAVHFVTLQQWPIPGRRPTAHKVVNPSAWMPAETKIKLSQFSMSFLFFGAVLSGTKTKKP